MFYSVFGCDLPVARYFQALLPDMNRQDKGNNKKSEYRAVIPIFVLRQHAVDTVQMQTDAVTGGTIYK